MKHLSRIHTRVFVLTALVGTILFTQSLYASNRVALVIGNGSYQSAPLRNPVHDATDMSAVLKSLGFTVITKIDVDKKEMIKAIDLFARDLRQAEIGLFYYAGHGMQINDRNYLIPVKVAVSSESDVEFESVDAGRVLGKMRSAGNKLNVVILDACRNNPFTRSFRSSSQGLARMDAPIGTIVAYATGPGAVAADGTGRNGIYTKHLLKAMQQPGLDIQNIFNEAGMAVMEETKRKQVPWTSNTPIPRYYLAGGSFLLEEQGTSVGDGTRSTGSLRITSNPQGATLFLDDRNSGNTPVTVSGLDAGLVNLRLELADYQTEQKQVRIRAGSRSTVSFVLSPINRNGWLTISPEPADALVRILNIEPRYSPGMELETGRYQVEVSAEGYEPVVRWLDLAAGESLDIDIALEKLPGPAVGATHTDPTTGMEFVWVEGGCFQMGDTFGDGYDNEQPVHEVCLDGLYVGKYEVTQGEYAKIMGTNPSRFNKGDRYPVELVSWGDAQSYIRKLNSRSGQEYRLPTEAEWEYAARSGGRKEKYAGGNSPDAVAWNFNNSGSTTHPVGRKQANGLGLYDMSGNVWEWCQDWYVKDYYSKSPRSNPTGPSSGSDRVIRGGSWIINPRSVRAADRDGIRPAIRYGNLGFRLVLPVQR